LAGSSCRVLNSYEKGGKLCIPIVVQAACLLGSFPLFAEEVLFDPQEWRGRVISVESPCLVGRRASGGTIFPLLLYLSGVGPSSVKDISEGLEGMWVVVVNFA
ncbi:hypothetical protein Ancab_016997, partial [Ancistrocladus abbreviatus]